VDSSDRKPHIKAKRKAGLKRNGLGQRHRLFLQMYLRILLIEMNTSLHFTLFITRRKIVGLCYAAALQYAYTFYA